MEFVCFFIYDLLVCVIVVLCEEELQCIIIKVEDGIWFGELVLGDMCIDV